MAEGNGNKILPGDWSMRLLCAAMSALCTGGTMYATQYLGFMKDSPTRREVAEMIKSGIENGPYMRERDTLRMSLEVIKNNQDRNYIEFATLNNKVSEIANKVGKLEVSITKKIGE